MYLFRDIMYCKPGKVRAVVEKFIRMSALMEKQGMTKMKIMTDVCAEQYWTVVIEAEAPSIDGFMAMVSQSPTDMKEMEEIMKGYHDLVDHGKREIYKLEG